jgi:hypothetical protein
MNKRLTITVPKQTKRPLIDRVAGKGATQQPHRLAAPALCEGGDTSEPAETTRGKLQRPTRRLTCSSPMV